MENNTNIESQPKSNFFINTISIVVPLVVAILLGLPTKLDLGDWTKTLPHAIGLINSLTTLILILGLVFIKLRKIKLHQSMMTAAFGLGHDNPLSAGHMPIRYSTFAGWQPELINRG